MPNTNSSVDDDNTPDIIPSILDGLPFKIIEDNEKLKILEKGRPQPKLNINKRDTIGNCNRTFQSSWYDIHRWLCGSKTYNKLFCWPCLLMRPESSSWCSTGTDDMKRFSSLASKHAVCKSHLKAIAEYDSILVNFNLPPEFGSDTNFKCKEEEEDPADQTSEEDLFNTYFNNESKNKTTGARNNRTRTKTTGERLNKNESESPNSKTKITFKNWQEMNKDSFQLNGSRFMDDLKLYKWKKRLAKQELKNARLTEEKLKFEVQVLQAKAEYYKSLAEEVTKSRNSSEMETDVVPEEKKESNSEV